MENGKKEDLSHTAPSTKLLNIKTRLNNWSRPRPNWLRRRFDALAALYLILGLGAGYLGAYAYNHHQALSSTSTAVKQQYISNESALIASIAKNVGQSVVSVDVQTESSQTDFFGFSHPVSQESVGTGFIISSGGLFVTNRYVVPGGTTSV